MLLGYTCLCCHAIVEYKMSVGCTACVLACAQSLHTCHLNDCGPVPNCCISVDSRYECSVFYVELAEGRSKGEIIQRTVLFVSWYPHEAFVVRCIGQRVRLGYVGN